MVIHRRDLLWQLGAFFAIPSNLSAARELTCDVAVIGGGTGGCAAALGALRNGMRVIWVRRQLEAGGGSSATLQLSTTK